MSVKPEEYEKFDSLTRQMGEILEVIGLAPEEHVPLHQLAFDRTYSIAQDLLTAQPELEEAHRKAAKLILGLTVERYTKFLSTRRVQDYLLGGLLAEGEVFEIPPRRVADAFRYNREDYEAFEVLFPPAVSEDEVEDEDLSQEEFENEVNTLDIIEHLEKSGLSPADLAIINRALGPVPARLDDLKREEWQLITLNNVEWEALISGFPGLRRNVQRLLKEVDIESRWLEVTAPRAKTAYQLLIGPDATKDKETETDPRAGLKQVFGPGFDAAPERRRPIIRTETIVVAKELPAAPEADVEMDRPTIERAILFARDLKKFMKHFLVIHADNRLNFASRQVAELLGDEVSRLEAREAISNLVRSGDLFKGPSVGGSRTLLAEQPTEMVRKRRNGEASNDSEQLDNKEFTAEDFMLIGQVCDALISARYQTKGLTTLEISRQLGVDEASIKHVVKHAVSAGLLGRQMRMVRSGSPRSKLNRQATFIIFPTQDAWGLYRENPGQYLSMLMG